MNRASDTLPAASWRRLPPALLALPIQSAAWLAALPPLALDWPLPAIVLIQGGAALLLSRLAGLPGWWQAIHLAFFPLAWLLSQAEIHPAWYLAGFALLALTSLGSLPTRVPLYLSSRQAASAAVARFPQGRALRVLDLGCGPGGWLAGIHALRPGLKLSGVELAPLNWLVSRLRLGGRADIRLGSLWDVDLSGYDVVYAYLSPAPMARLWAKITQEMRPGSLFISNTFAVPGAEPDETVELHDLSRARLLIWHR